MKILSRSISAAAMTLCSAAVLWAGPEISVDNANFDLGIIREGAVSTIEHTYKITNTGDDTLKISRVKPSCGCTAVGHDSVIAPGKQGKATAKVNISRFRPGKLRKYITIFSNSKKHPELSLSISCQIQSELSIEPSFIRLTPDEKGLLKKTLTVASNKSDLVISSVSFKENGGNSNGPAWQEELPIVFSHTLTKKDTTRKDGFTEYSLIITFAPPAGEALEMYGKFDIATNHPSKDLVTLNGNIEPPKK